MYNLGGTRLENSTLNNLDVYPNPSRDIFNVTFTSEEAQTICIRVVNILGEEIFTDNYTNIIGQFDQRIDLTKQAKGIYSLEISTPSAVIIKRLALQ